MPSVGGAPYTTRVVNPDGTPATDVYGADLGFTVLGTGNPADSGVAYGTGMDVQLPLLGNRAALVKITPPQG